MLHPPSLRWGWGLRAALTSEWALPMHCHLCFAPRDSLDTRSPLLNVALKNSTHTLSLKVRFLQIIRAALHIGVLSAPR
jgi:hypothetical protein